MEIPMLEEHEWREISPLLAESPESRQIAKARYKQITGFDETNPNAIAHHELACTGRHAELAADQFVPSGKVLRRLGKVARTLNDANNIRCRFIC